MLHREVLTQNTADLFDAIGNLKCAKGFILAGGTALSLQISHRISLDLDFVIYNERLPSREIDVLVNELKAHGRNVQRIVNPAQESAFKIQKGEPLGNFARDYVCDGVKLQFVAHGKNRQQREYYAAEPRVSVPGLSFELLGLDALMTAKTLVLEDRVRSRDLYDLMTLMQHHGYTVEKALNRAAQLGVNNDVEYYKAVMRGEIPLDTQDEGLEPVGANVSITVIYEYFDAIVSNYEIDLAKKLRHKQQLESNFNSPREI